LTTEEQNECYYLYTQKVANWQSVYCYYKLQFVVTKRFVSGMEY